MQHACRKLRKDVSTKGNVQSCYNSRGIHLEMMTSWGGLPKAGVATDVSNSDLDGWFRKQNVCGIVHVKCLGGEARQGELLSRFLKKQTLSVDPSRFFWLVTAGGHTSLGPFRGVGLGSCPVVTGQTTDIQSCSPDNPLGCVFTVTVLLRGNHLEVDLKMLLYSLLTGLYLLPETNIISGGPTCCIQKKFISILSSREVKKAEQKKWVIDFLLSTSTVWWNTLLRL